MMDPKVFGPQLERIMNGGFPDSPFWKKHLDELSPCQLGALYVAMRMMKLADHHVLDEVIALLGLSESWVVNGR